LRATLIIAAHHLRRLARRPGLVVLLMAVPVTLALIEYGAFGSGVAEGKLPPVKVLFLDEDASFASRFVPQFFSNGAIRDMFATATVADREAAKRAFERSEAAALIVVPKGFQDALLDGRDAHLVLYKNPIESIGPGIVEGVLEMVTAIGNRLYAEATAPVERIRELQKAGREPTSDEVAAISRGFFEAGRRFNRMTLLEKNTVAVQRPGAAPESRAGFGNRGEFFALFFPGLVIFAMMFLSQSLALGLLRDRLRGLEQRIAVTPASWPAIAAGGAVYLVTALTGVMAVLAIVGVGIFGLTLRAPLALLLITFGVALFAAGLQLVIVATARSDRSAGFMGTALLLILMLLGGTFVPAEQFPPWLRVLSFRVPNGAAQQAFIEVLAHKHGLGGIQSLVLVTWTWAILMMGAYVYLKRRSFAR
jgi:ABC-type multidrug transport system permease subunit